MLKLLCLSRGCRQIVVSITKIQHSHLKEIEHFEGSQVLPVGDRSQQDLKKQCIFVTSFPSLTSQLVWVQQSTKYFRWSLFWASVSRDIFARSHQICYKRYLCWRRGRQSLRLIFKGFVDLLTWALKLWRRVMSPLHLSWAWKQVVFHYIRFLDK